MLRLTLKGISDRSLSKRHNECLHDVMYYYHDQLRLSEDEIALLNHERQLTRRSMV